MAGFITNPKLIDELRGIYQKNDGLLTPEAIVDAARDKKTELHSHFEWDDSKAAEQYRLEQARGILQVTVEYLRDSKGKKVPCRVFVSLTSDRKGGGYRSTVDVMNDKDYKAQLLKDALDDLETFKRKYFELKELAVIFEAMRKVKKAA